MYKLFTPLMKKALKKTVKCKEEKVLFYSGGDYSDNAKVIFEYILEYRIMPKCEFYWLVKNVDKYKRKFDKPYIHFIKCVGKGHKNMPWPSIKLAFSCKLVFTTVMLPYCVLDSPNRQRVIQLWHGCGFKDTYVPLPYLKKNQYEVVFVPGKLFIPLKSSFFAMPEEKVQPLGYPRYDLMKNKNKKAIKFADKFQAGTKFVIWMPTFRKTKLGKFPEEKSNGFSNFPLINSMQQWNEIESLCTEYGITLFIKRHPLQVSYDIKFLNSENIFFLTNEDFDEAGINLYEFLPYTDALISDYSSVAIDYLLLDKPIAFILDDFEEYKNCRGFVFDDPRDFMPGHHIYSFEQLLEFLNDIKEENDKYAAERKRMLMIAHNPCDNYCQRILDYLDIM